MADTTVTPYSLADRLKEFGSLEGALLTALAPVVHAWLPQNVWTAIIPIAMAFVGAAKIFYPNNAAVQAVVTDVDTLVQALGQQTTTTTTTSVPAPAVTTIVANQGGRA